MTAQDYPPLFNENPIDEDGLWIFGYGSLMWRPGFEYKEKCSATLRSYHRAFCIYSHHHRGTMENPGLVLGLDQGGECVGVAFNVVQDEAREVIAYLDERELIGYAYKPMILDIDLQRTPNQAAERVKAYTFVADVEHPHYAGDLAVSRASTLIMNAQGLAGLNRDYLINTVRHLEQSGNLDENLHVLLKIVEQKTGAIDRGSGI